VKKEADGSELELESGQEQGQGGGTGVEAASAVEVKLCGNKQCQLNERCNPDYTAAYFNFNYATIIYPDRETKKVPC